MAARRKQTLQGIAPLDEDGPSSGVRASARPPASAVRLVAPRGVPRPASAPPPRIVPPRIVPPRIRPAEPDSRGDHLAQDLDDGPTEVDFPPPPVATPSERARVRTRVKREPGAVNIPVPHATSPSREVIPPPGATPVPSLTMTSQNWPIVRAPIPTSPGFGIAYGREEIHSLPAFVVPRSMLADAALVHRTPVEADAQEITYVDAECAPRDPSRLDDMLVEDAWMHDALTRSRRRRMLGIVAVAVFSVVALLLSLSLR